MKITTIALAVAAAWPVMTWPAAAFAASPDPEGAAGSTAGVYGGESSSTTAQDEQPGATRSTDSGHNIIPNPPSTTGAAPGAASGDPTSDMSGSGGANTGQKTTATPRNAGPREPGDMTGGSPAR